MGKNRQMTLALVLFALVLAASLLSTMIVERWPEAINGVFAGLLALAGALVVLAITLSRREYLKK